MVVLGVDSGSISTGFGLVEGLGQVNRALDFGAIRCDSATPHPQRLGTICGRLREIIRRFTPSVLAIEKVFVSRNASSALKLGQVRGAVMLTAVEEGLEVREFAPNEVKMAVTGYGHAEKEQVQLMVKTLLGLKAIPTPHDAADALALALCALAQDSWTRRISP
jgi:crossover junction endodeoxyribonuclease RuvC